MSENFQDFVLFGQSALDDLGDAFVVGGTNTNAASKSVIFNNNSTSGALVWGPSANRTISLPDANGVILLSSQGVLSLSAGAAQITSGQVVFSNSNGVSFGVNGQTVTASVAAAGGNVNFSAGTTSSGLNSVVFSNSNGVSFGLNGSTITASHAINLSAGTTSNNLSAVTFSNSNGVSFGLNGSTVTGSVATSLTNINLSAGTTSNNLSAFVFSNSNNISFGLNGSTVTGSMPTFTGVGGITVSTNGATVSISGPNMTIYEPYLLNSTTSFLPAQNSWYFEPVYIPANLSGGRINRILNFQGTANILVGTTSASYGTGTSGTLSASQVFINTLALYTQANSTALSSIWSNSFSVGISFSQSISQAGGASITVKQGATMSYVVSIDASGNYTTTSLGISGSTNTSSVAMGSTAMTSVLSSMRNMLSSQLYIPVGFNTTISEGNYWLAQAISTGLTTGGTSQSVWPFVGLSAVSIATVFSGLRNWGATVAAGALVPFFPGRGEWWQSSSVPPNGLNLTLFNATTGIVQYFNWINSGYNGGI